MYCSLNDLHTESDVEQKLLWPFLTMAPPNGAGFAPPDVLTKLSIRRLEIGKGANSKLFFPDYMIVLCGLPVLVVEAKAPGQPIAQALDEARLYANELNALFPSGVNPCIRVAACNGNVFVSAPVDTDTPDVRVEHHEISAGSASFVKLTQKLSRNELQRHADSILTLTRKATYRRAVSFVGGPSVQDEELPPNTFGATISGDYGHVFNPRSRDDRAFIVREGYVPSLRRQRYVEPIDRLIRNAVIPATARLPVLEDTSVGAELNTILRDRKNLEHEVLLLVGSVGSGKSTFVDYVSVVALPDELRRKTIWARLNLNDAPLAPEVAYTWIARALITELKQAIPEEDVDDLHTLDKILYPELTAVKKGPLSLLPPESVQYKTRLADEMLKLQRDVIGFSKCLARYVCGGPNRLLVIVLDNCDKRTRDEQLTMFQVAQWVRTEYKSLVILPLRDITFDRHRLEPPLDTALKGLIFRIEPPPLIKVLQERVRLALGEMDKQSKLAPTLSYDLPNGMRVSYPASDQSLYLASILKSLYAHDRFVRRILTGLAGRDVRRALEVFLDFCTSGHIGEDEIYKIRYFEGKHILPLSVVARVLLRMQRRYYDGQRSYVKNLVQCDPNDLAPDHFVRLAILHWLERVQAKPGPSGILGFHNTENLIRQVTQLGHEAGRIRKELLYLVREGLVIAEHQRVDDITDSDLVKITASGLVHLQLMANPEYLAACAEDTYISDIALAERIATRITSKGLGGQFSRATTAKNAADIVSYLKERASERIARPDLYLEDSEGAAANMLREAEAAVGATEIEVSKRLYVGNLAAGTSADQLSDAFATAGLRIREVAIAPRPSSNASKWFSIVEMVDGRSAMAAIDSPSLTIGGRRLLINEAYSLADQVTGHGRRTPRIDISERLYVTGLAKGVTESGLRTLFSKHGFQPLEVYVPKQKVSGGNRGFGFATMGSRSEAMQAIGAMNGALLDGARIGVRPAEPR